MINRKLNRLSEYNYTNEGMYYVTLCTKDRIEYFSKIDNNNIILNDFGFIADNYWNEIPKHYNNVSIDNYVIMPNHIHGIILIYENNVGTEQCSVPTNKNIHYGLLSKIIKSYKEACVKYIKQKFNDFEFGWQRSFYDHIIRNEKSLQNIRDYINDNPFKWELDEYYKKK